jgi:NhaP-type Na+/H+ or K+/H+ antiporter
MENNLYEVLALFAGLVLLYSIFAGAVERTWISGPMVFIAVGLLVGPLGLNLVPFEIDREILSTLAELTLALVLFTDAAGADLKALRGAVALPVRLLLIGLPLTIVLGYLAGRLLNMDLSYLELAIVATMLAPTDAALGQAVVENELVPDKVRQALNVESGLNDGICVPILFVFLALVLESGGGQSTWELAARLVATEIGIGVAVGVVLTAVIAQLLKVADRRQWLTPIWAQIPVVGLALTCFAIAQLLGGSGFIAAFTGGLLFGGVVPRLRDRLLEAAEGAGDAFSVITWIIFGAAVIALVIGSFDWRIMFYAVLSLTVVRMVPVFLCLSGSGLNTETKLFMGWFGPRGLASIVFAIIVLDAHVPNSDTLAMMVACTVILSVVAHGVTANPLAKAYGMRARREGES